MPKNYMYTLKASYFNAYPSSWWIGIEVGQNIWPPCMGGPCLFIFKENVQSLNITWMDDKLVRILILLIESVYGIETRIFNNMIKIWPPCKGGLCLSIFKANVRALNIIWMDHKFVRFFILLIKSIFGIETWNLNNIKQLTTL